tara:strand:- start:962 stop:1132 length:171 start_codon:yes stop_codon:yes gene_type:complete
MNHSLSSSVIDAKQRNFLSPIFSFDTTSGMKADRHFLNFTIVTFTFQCTSKDSLKL